MHGYEQLTENFKVKDSPASSHFRRCLSFAGFLPAHFVIDLVFFFFPLKVKIRTWITYSSQVFFLLSSTGHHKVFVRPENRTDTILVRCEKLVNFIQNAGSNCVSQKPPRNTSVNDYLSFLVYWTTRWLCSYVLNDSRQRRMSAHISLLTTLSLSATCHLSETIKDCKHFLSPFKFTQMFLQTKTKSAEIHS